jgi:hypothetical protein
MDVVEYFTEAGFPEQATAFQEQVSPVPSRPVPSPHTHAHGLCGVSADPVLSVPTQEIDGKSLLLMQRTDVLTGLSIRLGPALKIYEHHIKVLQQGHFEDDDPDGFLG